MPSITPEQFNYLPEPATYQGMGKLITDRFNEAVEATNANDREMFFTIDTRPDAIHRLGVISLAEDLESLRRRKAEILEIAVPLLRADIEHPLPILGSTPATNYFYLTYMAMRGGRKTLRVDPLTYDRRFLGRGKPPVRDFEQKLATYEVLPLRKKPEVPDDSDS